MFCGEIEMKYEYYVFSVRIKKYTPDFVKYLNEMGNTGWVLVSAETSTLDNDWTNLIWIREITGESND